MMDGTGCIFVDEGAGRNEGTDGVGVVIFLIAQLVVELEHLEDRKEILGNEKIECLGIMSYLPPHAVKGEFYLLLLDKCAQPFLLRRVGSLPLHQSYRFPHHPLLLTSVIHLPSMDIHPKLVVLTVVVVEPNLHPPFGIDPYHVLIRLEIPDHCKQFLKACQCCLKHIQILAKGDLVDAAKSKGCMHEIDFRVNPVPAKGILLHILEISSVYDILLPLSPHKRLNVLRVFLLGLEHHPVLLNLLVGQRVAEELVLPVGGLTAQGGGKRYFVPVLSCNGRQSDR